MTGTGANGDGDKEEDKDCVPRRPTRPSPSASPARPRTTRMRRRRTTVVPRRADRGPTSAWQTPAGVSPRCGGVPPPLAVARAPR